MKAGGSGMEAADIADKLTAKIREGTTTQEIREEVISELSRVDGIAAGHYYRHEQSIGPLR